MGIKVTMVHRISVACRLLYGLCISSGYPSQINLPGLTMCTTSMCLNWSTIVTRTHMHTYHTPLMRIHHTQTCTGTHGETGKGRTGLMISAFLAYEGEAVCAETGKTLRIVSSADALALFDRRRTLDPSGHSQGVTGISQLRCVAAGKRQG